MIYALLKLIMLLNIWLVLHLTEKYYLEIKKPLLPTAYVYTNIINTLCIHPLTF